jgi:hypothetical protein
MYVVKFFQHHRSAPEVVVADMMAVYALSHVLEIAQTPYTVHGAGYDVASDWDGIKRFVRYWMPPGSIWYTDKEDCIRRNLSIEKESEQDWLDKNTLAVSEA